MSEPRSKLPKGKMLLQQCSIARIQVAPATSSRDAEFVEIGKGIVIFVCFLEGASLQTVQKMARLAMDVKLCGDYDERVSVLDLPGDVLIAPQSTLGGLPKGHRVSYNHILKKEEGCVLYESFVKTCRDIVESSDQSAGRVVRSGTYANKNEAFTLQSDGPFTHLFEFDD